MTTALVTGSNGFVGRHLAAHLIRSGIKVRGFDLRNGADVRDYEQVRTAVERADPDYVFHLAAQAYVPETTTDVRRGLDTNVGGTLNLLEAVRHTGSTARILLAGTSEEYGYDHPGPVITEDTVCRPTTPYGVSKLAAGHLGLVYARTYGIPVVVTRAFNHTGPGQPPRWAVPSLAKRVAEVEAGRRDRVEHGNLDAVRNYTDVRDIVRAYALAIELPAGVYNLCSPNTVSVRWILTTLRGLARRSIPTALDEALYRPGTAAFPHASCERFTALTGWKAEIPLEQTLADVLDYWRGNL